MARKAISRLDSVTRKTHVGGDRLRKEMLAHFRRREGPLRRRWMKEMETGGYLRGGTSEELEADSVAIYDAYLTCLETGHYHRAQALAKAMAARGILRRLTPKHIFGALLTLQGVCEQSLTQKYGGRPDRLVLALELFKPVANRILVIVALAFLQEREGVVRRGVEQFRALVEAGMVLAKELSLESVLQKIAELACKVVGAKYGAVGMLNEDSKGLSQFITVGIDEETKARIGSLPVGKGVLGVLVREAKPLRLNELSNDPRAHGFPAHHPPMRSFLGVPIVSKGKVFGNLYLTEKQGAEAFSKEDEALAVTLAAQAAIAVENASLYEEVHRSYEQLRRSQDLLLRQEKLASLGRLAAGLAHEINNPLSSVAGFAEALQRRAQAERLHELEKFQDVPEYLALIQQEVGRASAIVRRLLDFARQREPSFENLNLGSLIRETVALIRSQAVVTNKRIELNLPRNLPVVQADRHMLQQVFLNLLTNALDAIEGEGEVRIAAFPVPGQVEVVLQDTGCGIPREHLARIFDPFFTTKDVGKGTGLGLAICQGILEQHGGSIEVRSDGLGTGTTVAVRLPVAATKGGDGS
ncbi:MAG: GAF domain-containing protein [candidate division NC10 bacterium]|nr:GAF domain-containing protein [candidate division NC10 bacterium]